MANILDIFRTQTGTKLLEKSNNITGIHIELLQKAFVFTFPTLLNIYSTKISSEIEKPKDLVAFIENENLIEFGKKETKNVLNQKEQKFILAFSEILAVENKSFKDILHISTAVISVIISEIEEKYNAEYSGIVKTLQGLDMIYNEAFVKVLIKNADDPNFIENSENISLTKDTKDSSILGGYAGGR